MSSIIQYIARRSLHGDHTVGQSYEIEVEVAIDSLQMQVDEIKFIARSPGGAMVQGLERIDRSFPFRIIGASGTQLGQLQEFLDSTESGESFRLWACADDSPRDVPYVLKRTDEGHVEVPFVRTGLQHRDEFAVDLIGLLVAQLDDEGDVVDSDGSDIYDPESDPDGTGTGGLQPSTSFSISYSITQDHGDSPNLELTWAASGTFALEVAEDGGSFSEVTPGVTSPLDVFDPYSQVGGGSTPIFRIKSSSGAISGLVPLVSFTDVGETPTDDPDTTYILPHSVEFHGISITDYDVYVVSATAFAGAPNFINGNPCPEIEEMAYAGSVDPDTMTPLLVSTPGAGLTSAYAFRVVARSGATEVGRSATFVYGAVS